ncbi:MAG: uracil-DNA glycosylase [bacterium]|nr:uracil-DNA glycosylase [bacterium]
MSSTSPPASSAANDLDALARRLVRCRRCPRLVAHRMRVARDKVARFRDWTYWGRPVPGFGDPGARIVVVGLAPAAHGANRTGRIFTGDESGNWLYAALHRAGFASQPTSTDRDDGLALTGVWVTAAARCAPPANRPAPDELDACRPWLVRESGLLASVRVVVALGRIGHDAVLALERAEGHATPRPRPGFAHGAEHRLGSGRMLICSYHPSQQNTFTGRLTRPMLDAVFARARRLARFPPRGAGGNGGPPR